MRICITRSENYSYSETFIRDQIKGFSELSKVYPIHSGRFPEREESGKLLSPKLFWILHKIFKLLLGRNNVFSNYGVIRFLKKNKIEVVLANYGMSASHMVPVCKKLGIPLLVIFHGHDATDNKLLKIYKNKYIKLFDYATSIIVVSEDMKHKIIGLGANVDKVEVVPCGVDVFKFSPTKHVIESKKFLSVGRFTRKKGPLYTIQAFNKVLQVYPDAKLTMVGGKKGMYAECVQLVEDLGINKSVVFTGVLDQVKIAKLMKESLAFVQHSITAPNGDMEGTPVSIMEAASCGLPIVSTFHGGIRDAVIHEETGYLVEEKDVDKMADYMILLCDDPKNSKKLGVRGCEHIKINYNQEFQVKKLFELAKKAL